jgi:S-adenosyl-L-methionine hydrolase (adenosine-forming)
MQIITLTTDFGQKDWYAGALKGALLHAVPSAQLVDISHQIDPFDIVQGGLALQNTWHEFPAGTLHCVAVNCAYDAAPQFVLAAHGDHFFMAPNNGVLSLFLGQLPVEQTRLLSENETVAQHFAVKAIYAKALAQWQAGTPLKEIGAPMSESLLQRIGLSPVINAQQIRGTVVHVDQFDNVVLNIERSVFERAAKGREFALYFRKNDPITVLSNNYSDVPMGEPLCLFNHAGLLEIAVNFGRAATLLGLKKEDVVEVVFQ